MPSRQAKIVTFLAALAIAGAAGWTLVQAGGLGPQETRAAPRSTGDAVLAQAQPDRPRSQAERSRTPDWSIDDPAQSDRRRGEVRFRSPYVHADVDRRTGTVWLRSPIAAVDVDRDGGRVRVRAPFGDFDLSW